MLAYFSPGKSLAGQVPRVRGPGPRAQDARQSVLRRRDRPRLHAPPSLSRSTRADAAPATSAAGELVRDRAGWGSRAPSRARPSAVAGRRGAGLAHPANHCRAQLSVPPPNLAVPVPTAVADKEVSIFATLGAIFAPCRAQSRRRARRMVVAGVVVGPRRPALAGPLLRSRSARRRPRLQCHERLGLAPRAKNVPIRLEPRRATGAVCVGRRASPHAQQLPPDHCLRFIPCSSPPRASLKSTALKASAA